MLPSRRNDVTRSRPTAFLTSVVPSAFQLAATTFLVGFPLANGTSGRKIRASSRCAA